MKKFDLKKITEEDIFTGDIYIVTNTTFVSVISVLAKKDAVLIRIDEDYYVDVDAIKSINDIKNINQLLSSGDYDYNNILLSDKLNNAYVGKLFIDSIENKKFNDINILKFKNTLK